MQMFSDLPFRWKIGLPVIALAGLQVITGVIGVHSIDNAVKSGTDVTTRYLPAVSLLLNADRDLYQAHSAERSLLESTGNHRNPAELLQQIEENAAQAYDRVQQFKALNPSPDALQMVAEFETHFSRWRESIREVARLTQSNPAAAAELSFGVTEQLFNQTRDVMDKLGELEDREAAEANAAAIAEGEEHKTTEIIAVGASLLICALFVIMLPGVITRPLHKVLRRLEEIADGDGDLRVRLDIHSRDEIGQLSKSFNRFIDRLQTLIKEVSSVTNEVASFSNQLAGIAERNDRLTSQQHSAIDQVSTAATEMSAAVSEVARNAHSAADAVRHAEGQSLEGARVVDTTIHAINQLAQEVESASTTIQTLEQETANIGAVLEVIKGIAEQTNLLALNAAIEAARAGEQGRGFAVVADEVRALAARTQESTKDIQSMIERLRHGVDNAVHAMYSGSVKARESVARAADADKALNAATHSVHQIIDMAAQIAAATEEQSAVTDDIARNINEIRDLSVDASQATEESARASLRLSELSTGLSRTVGRFRV